MKDLELTLQAIHKHKWIIILLEPNSKRPLMGRTWAECRTQDIDLIAKHLENKGGIGLDVYLSNLCVLDFDSPDAASEMAREYFPLLPPTVISPSKGFHIYIAALPDLPAIIEWKNQRIGEIIRGPNQHVVLPPSPYPGNSKRKIPAGGFYKWLVDPRLDFYELNPEWKKYFRDQVPKYIARNFLGHPKDDLWDGPSPEEIISRALLQPGARRRRIGVKFQCPQCREDGHDKHKDNAIVFNDGRWACAHSPGDVLHRSSIGKALGIISENPSERIPFKNEDKYFKKYSLEFDADRYLDKYSSKPEDIKI